MQSPNHPDEEFMDSEEDANMEDQVVPEIPMSQPSPTLHQHQPPPQREEEPNTLEPLAQTLYLRSPLTLDMLLNIEKKFLINVPQEVTKADLNIRCYNSQQPLKYVALVIPIIKNKQTLEMENTEEMQATVNLEMALTPGGSSNSPESPLMKIFLWNCRGANNAKFMNNIRALIDSHNPTILALTETRMEDHDKILQALDYTDVIQVPAFGYSGGIALLWRNSEINVEPFVITEQEIHVTIKVSSSFPKFFFSVIYAKNTYGLRKILWENLKNITARIKGPWLVCGDFNEVTNASEKLGGRPINNTKCAKFISCLDDMDMIDLGFTGQKYTWSNKHKNNNTLIMERIDRFLSNHSWLNLFPDSHVHHLPRTHSDHVLFFLTVKEAPITQGNSLDSSPCGLGILTFQTL
ncbi:hypothetical protein KY284_012808 [Solanum tuberosum]|nr:hypothetical protein KY284_012808 [Solanum tuberosum]